MVTDKEVELLNAIRRAIAGAPTLWNSLVRQRAEGIAPAIVRSVIRGIDESQYSTFPAQWRADRERETVDAICGVFCVKA